MSRYAVNKVLWQVARDDEAAARYLDSPESVLAGGRLTDIERRQLLDRDIPGLFAVGAHPFLLYTFMIKVSGGWSFPMMTRYVNSLKDIEPPIDIST